MKINLISDTVTKPTKEMKKVMLEALVGDDVFGEDPSVNHLQSKLADMFGMEAGSFCPSGTMTNQIAIKVHTQPLDELICDKASHVYQYETAGYSYNSGVGVNLIDGDYGKITAEQVQKSIKQVYDWLPISKLVVLENSTNKGGGNYYELDEIAKIKQVCDDNNLVLHLDGARLFNVLVETGESTIDVGRHFDSISICLSKGLGAPVGSVLLGKSEFIRKARRFRKVMGGGMRQSGFLAAACTYALDNNIDRLKIDNNNAKELGALLSGLSFVKSVNPVKTNIVIFTLKDQKAVDFVAKLAMKDIIAAAFGEYQVRFVTHLEFTEEMKIRLFEVLRLIND